MKTIEEDIYGPKGIIATLGEQEDRIEELEKELKATDNHNDVLSGQITDLTAKLEFVMENTFEGEDEEGCCGGRSLKKLYQKQS